MRRVMALSGGVGGAKLALGLAHELPPAELLVVANVGDDFDHLGLRICPDLDTLMYTLSGKADPERGWGLAGESWHCLEALAAIGGPDWFRLGDRDLATHLVRSEALRAGHTLSGVTQDLCRALGIAHPLVPVTDGELRTLVSTDAGELSFQDYFVRRQCAPRVSAVRFAGAAEATPSPAVQAWLAGAPGGIVVVCPSNPWLSVDPLLAVPGLRAQLDAHVVFAVAPIVAGQALKGPAAKMMAELGLEPSAAAVARHYRGLVDVFVIDAADAGQAADIAALGMDVLVVPTVMRTLADKRELARAILAHPAACV